MIRELIIAIFPTVVVTGLAILIQELRGKKALEQLRKDFNKDLKAYSEDMRKNQPVMFETNWKAKYPGRPIPPEVKEIFTGIVESTATALANYDYTAKGGLKLWGEAGTIIGGPEGEIPPIIDDLET